MPSQTLTCTPCCPLQTSYCTPHMKTNMTSLISSFIGPINYTLYNLTQFIVVHAQEEFSENSNNSLQLIKAYVNKKPCTKNSGLIQRLICQKIDEGLLDFICLLPIKITNIALHGKPAHSKNQLYSFLTLICSSITISKESPLLPLIDSLLTANSLQCKRLWTGTFIDFNNSEPAALEDLAQQKEKSLEEEEIEHCEEASTASASSRSIEIREDLNALFIQTSSLEDFSEDLGLDRADVNQSKNVVAKEMFSYYDGFDIGDLCIPFDSSDKMLCMAKGPVQEKKAKNKFLSLNSTRRTNTFSNSPCSSPALSDGSVGKQLSSQHSKFMRPPQNVSRSNFMASGNSSFWKKQSNSCYGEQRKVC